MLSIDRAQGFLVADSRGRAVGHVECALYGASPSEPDAMAVRGGFLRRRHFLVPAAAISAIDDVSQVIGLGVERQELRRFL